MILEGAPVTGLTLLLSAVSSVMVRGQFTRHRSNAFAAATTLNPSTTFTAVKRLLLKSLPLCPLGFSIFDVLLAVNLLYQFRTLERRWGSNNYLAFLLSSSAVGVCATQLLVTESGSQQLSVDAVHIFSAVGTLVPLAALVTRYMREVPSLHMIMQRIPGTSTAMTEKSFVLLPLLKLVFNPATQIDSQTYRHAAVVVDVGIWTRLLCALFGFLFATFSTRSVTLQWWLTFFAKYICRPVLRFLRPLTEILFGASFSVDHATPRHRQHTGSGGGGSAAVVEDGRNVVESLTGGTALQEVRARMRARRHAQGRVPPAAAAAASTAASVTPPPPVLRRNPREEAARASAVLAIEALGLPVSRDEIAAALDMTEGNVETAVEVLLGR